MRLSNEATIPAPPDEVFRLLTDVERIAPCLPGAAVSGGSDGEFEGSMTVKVGPVTAQYAGTIRIVEQDPGARRTVMVARATDARGQGSAEAKIVAAVEDAGGASLVRLDTDLQMRGRVAQLGGGAIQKVSERMFGRFAENLAQLGAGGALEAAPTPPPAAPPRRADVAAVPGIDGGVLRRAGGALAVALAAFSYGYLIGRLRELRGRTP